MNIKQRLNKLESSIMPVTEPVKIGRFVVDVGGTEPIGYRSDNGVEISRLPGESLEALRKRCYEAVTWADFNYRHIFQPMYGESQ